MQSAGRQADQHVAFPDALACDQVAALDCADDKAREVVFALGIKPRHLCGLAADERAAVAFAPARDAGNHLRCDVSVESADRKIVKEEQRRGALNRNIIHAVVDQVLADGVMPARRESELQFCADAVGRTHQYGTLPTLQQESAAKTADVR